MTKGIFDPEVHKSIREQKAIARIEGLKAQVEELKAWKDAVDEALDVALLTADSFATPKDAVNALCTWHEEVGDFFGRERIGE